MKKIEHLPVSIYNIQCQGTMGKVKLSALSSQEIL